MRDNKIVREALNLRETTRLGEGLKKGGKLRPEARERTSGPFRGLRARCWTQE